MAGKEIEDADLFGKLPEEIIEEVVSLIGPMEACRLSVVCKRFLSAAESNTVWERFLPSDYQQFLDRADSLPNIKFAHKKDVFLFFIGNHVIFDGNTLVIPSYFLIVYPLYYCLAKLKSSETGCLLCLQLHRRSQKC